MSGDFVVKTVSIKLNPTQPQREELEQLFEAARAGVNFCLPRIERLAVEAEARGEGFGRFTAAGRLHSTRGRSVPWDDDLTKFVHIPLKTHYDSIVNQAFSIWRSYRGWVRRREAERRRLQRQVDAEADERLQAALRRRLKRLRPVSFPAFRGGSMLIHKSLLSVKEDAVHLSIWSRRSSFDYYGKDYLRPYIRQLEAEKQQPRAYLIRRGGDYYLQLPLRVPIPSYMPGNLTFAVSFGVRKVAAIAFEGEEVRGVRFFPVTELRRRKDRFFSKRRALTTLHGGETERELKGRRRKVKAMRGREAAFVKTFNHQLTRRIVNHVKQLRGRIAFIDFSGIRRVKYGDPKLNRTLSGWGVKQQQALLTHKAALEGIPIQTVPYTRVKEFRCSRCGKTFKSTLTQILIGAQQFKCPSCGYEVNWHVNLAKNIMVTLKK